MSVDPQHLSEQIVRRAQQTLDPLLVEMTLNKWPDEFRTIMWNAVADLARALATTPPAGGET